MIFERLLNRVGKDLFVASEDVVSKIWVCHRLLSTVCDGLCIAFVQERSGVIRSRVIVIVDLFVAFVQAWPEIRFFLCLLSRVCGDIFVAFEDVLSEMGAPALGRSLEPLSVRI